MIKVCYSELDGPKGLSLRLEAAGHAGYAPAGQDIVCAGASTLMQALVYLLAGEESARSDAWDEPDGPRLAVAVQAPVAPWVQGAFELAKAGFTLLAERYPDNLRFADVSRSGQQSMMDLQLFAEGEAAPALSPAQSRQAVAAGTLKPEAPAAQPEVPQQTPAEPEPQPEEEPDASSEEADSSAESGDASASSSEAAASSAASSHAASSKPAAHSAASSHAASSSHSAASSHAASSSHSASSSTSASSGSSHTTETTDAKVNAYVRRLRNLQKRSSKKLYQTASSAYSEYMEHPVEERNLALKVSIVLGKTMELTKLQSECDKEFKEIVTELRQYLRENGYDQSIADAAEKEYKEEKDAMIKELTNVTYSQVTGKGEGGKWLQEHADMGQ